VALTQRTDDASPANHLARRSVQQPEGVNLLLSDIRFAFLLANEARYRALERAFGIQRSQANIVTLVAALLVLESMQDRTSKAFTSGRPPSAGEMALGVTAAREALYAVAGPAAREGPLFASLVMLAVAGAAVRPVVWRSLRNIRTSSQARNVKFRQRYGYIVDPGHWRERRTQQQAAAGAAKSAAATAARAASAAAAAAAEKAASAAVAGSASSGTTSGPAS
jgi:hypothetical protein